MPKLTVIHSPDPYMGGCSHCQATFTIPTDTAEAERPQRLRQEFEKHIREKHPEFLKEDASQAATRIVREATE